MGLLKLANSTHLLRGRQLRVLALGDLLHRCWAAPGWRPGLRNAVPLRSRLLRWHSGT